VLLSTSAETNANIITGINLMYRGAARNFVREGPVTDVIRFQTLAILHKDHFDVTGQLLVCYNRI